MCSKYTEEAALFLHMDAIVENFVVEDLDHQISYETDISAAILVDPVHQSF